MISILRTGDIAQHDENPLDRISSGPAPTGPSPWRSSRLPTGSPYANGVYGNGLYGTGDARSPRRLGRAGWITLIVAVALIAGAIGWAAVSKPSSPTFTSPIGTGTVPQPPSLEQVTSSNLFGTQLTTPTCALPAWAPQPEAIQGFADAANRCLEGVWGLRPYRVEVFAAPDDIAPGTACPAGYRVPSISSCGDVTFINRDRIIASAGNQAGVALQWLSLSVAGRAAGRSGLNTDVDALVRVNGGPSNPVGAEYLKRRHMQSLCLSGATLARLVGTSITRTDLEQASADSAGWTVLSQLGDADKLSRANTRSWFDRGSLSPTIEVCRTAWTTPVDQVS